MEPTETLNLFYEESVVGTVSVYANSGLGFSYEPAWISADDSFPLSVTLPLKEGEFPSEVIGPWLDNLLPEGGQRKRVAEAIGVTDGFLSQFVSLN